MILQSLTVLLNISSLLDAYEISCWQPKDRALLPPEAANFIIPMLSLIIHYYRNPAIIYCFWGGVTSIFSKCSIYILAHWSILAVAPKHKNKIFWASPFIPKWNNSHDIKTNKQNKRESFSQIGTEPKCCSHFPYEREKRHFTCEITPSRSGWHNLKWIPDGAILFENFGGCALSRNQKTAPPSMEDGLLV